MKRSEQAGSDSRKNLGIFLSEQSPVGSVVSCLVKGLEENIARPVMQLLKKRLLRLRHGLQKSDYLAVLLDEIPWNLPEELAGLGMGGEPSRLDYIHISTALKKGWVIPRYTPAKVVDLVTHARVEKILAPYVQFVENRSAEAKSHYEKIYSDLCKSVYCGSFRVFDVEGPSVTAHAYNTKYTRINWNHKLWENYCYSCSKRDGDFLLPPKMGERKFCPRGVGVLSGKCRGAGWKDYIERVEGRALRMDSEKSSERRVLGQLANFWRGVRSDKDLYYGERRPVFDLVKLVQKLEPIALVSSQAPPSVEFEIRSPEILQSVETLSDLAACQMLCSELFGMSSSYP